jgi:hypothetical protein
LCETESKHEKRDTRREREITSYTKGEKRKVHPHTPGIMQVQLCEGSTTVDDVARPTTPEPKEEEAMIDDDDAAMD